MIDLTSFFIITGVIFGLLTGNAALYGDTLRVQIAVPDAVSNAGFGEAAAEEVFTAEATKIVRAQSIIPVPTLRVHSSPSTMAALVRPLNLDGVAAALQTQFGINHLMVAGAMLAEVGADKAPPQTAVRPLTPGVKLDLVLVVTQPHETPVQTVLEQADGDATMLMRRGASWAMEQVSPYRVVLTYALDGARGDPTGLMRAQEAAQRLLKKPWDPQRASEIALTRDVLALIAMHDGDLQEADKQLSLAQGLPDVVPAAHSIIALNHCFLAVARKQPEQAATLLQAARGLAARVTLPHFGVHLELTQALVEWSRGDTAQAETVLRRVAESEPNDDTAHYYLAQLLLAGGDKDGAAAEERKPQHSHYIQDGTEALAIDLFWTDPIHGGILKRP